MATIKVVLFLILSLNSANSQSARSFKHEVVSYVENCLDPKCDNLRLTLVTATRTFVLDLQKAQNLFSDDYFEQIGNQEPVRVLNGRSASDVPGMDCFYESKNPTIFGSVSLCGPGIEGSFSSPEGFFIVHFDTDLKETCLFKSDDLPVPLQPELGDVDQLLAKWKSEIPDRSMEEVSSRAVSANQEMYLEILAVVDQEAYQHNMKRNMALVKAFVNSYAAHANAVYKNKNEPVVQVNVVIIGLIVWTEGDPILFDRQGRCKKDECTIGERLDDMIHYNAKHLYPKYHQDTTVFFTGKNYPGSAKRVAGVAYKGLTCNAPELAAHMVLLLESLDYGRTTATHEMGHNLGFEDNLFSVEDNRVCRTTSSQLKRCYDGCPKGKCMMFACAKAGFHNFDACSRLIFKMRKEDGKYWCLYNRPISNMKPESTFLSFCGNGIVEGQETCDCLPNDKLCLNCCSERCQLKDGSECANGPCCSLCKFKSSNETCDTSIDAACKKSLKCTGMSANCPDEMLIEEKSCGKDNNKYCFQGNCVYKCPQNCFNHGECRGNIRDGFHCECYTMYYGALCQTRMTLETHFAFGAVLGVIAFFITLIIFRLIELRKAGWRYRRLHVE